MKVKIGIFDSGIGGFTILNSLLKARKDVEVFYLADTKRIPFGNKNFNIFTSFQERIKDSKSAYSTVKYTYFKFHPNLERYSRIPFAIA